MRRRTGAYVVACVGRQVTDLRAAKRLMRLRERNAATFGAERADDLGPARAGDVAVDSPVTCAITRFRLHNRRSLLPTYFDYRRVAEQALLSDTPGLLRYAFLVENPTTFYSLSIWSEPEAIAHFGTNVPLHVSAARAVFGRLLLDPKRGPELWSTKWTLSAVSNNLNWGNQAFLGQATPASQDLAAAVEGCPAWR